MAELQQLRVQEAVDSMVKSLERENIRKMQVARLGPNRDPLLSGWVPGPSLSHHATPGTAAASPETRCGRPWGRRGGLGQDFGSFGRSDEIRVPSPCARLFSAPSSPGQERPRRQGLMFRCSASCCEDSQASMKQVHQCIERCHVPLAQAQALVTSELEKFQDRLARCTMHCNDKAKDSIDAGSKELQVKQQLDSCVTKCVDDHMHLIPTMTKKMKEALLSIGK
ncbi:LOW QUALITY PROTEIN: protein FAM136A [Macaca fascicularis]|uniref:LOW QUALITY PROTEIN: protein FAM136A n=1 Tax=Macaca fascicularis TaxID=9541 RepID=UPI0032B05525